jgi:hypothetical protein
MSGAEVQEVPDGYLVVCPQHNLIRGVESGQHAANLQALHNRIDHADDTDSIEVDLTAAARALIGVWEDPGTTRPERAAVLTVWQALTGLTGKDPAVTFAREIAAAPEPLVAAVAPF